MRPDSIVWFERLSIGSLALGLVGAYLQWEELAAIGSVGFVLIIFGVMLTARASLMRMDASPGERIIAGIAAGLLLVAMIVQSFAPGVSVESVKYYMVDLDAGKLVGAARHDEGVGRTQRGGDLRP